LVRVARVEIELQDHPGQIPQHFRKRQSVAVPVVRGQRWADPADLEAVQQLQQMAEAGPQAKGTMAAQQ
jgi:hypothetical protein